MTTAAQDQQNSPRSAYVHVPFCRHKCGYCNFTVIAGRDDLMQSYLTAIRRELEGLERPYSVSTLFLGGGTPTHLPPSHLQQLLDLVVQWFPLEEGTEFSVEANPEDLDAEVVDVLSAAGVNRVSLGMQSFSPTKLRGLERGHLGEQAEECFRLLRPHIRSLSMDLIFATPGETVDAWQADLASALLLSPDHVSTYGLTFEKGTPFYSRLKKSELMQVEEDAERAMYVGAIDTLQDHGFEHYEVSNFARPGHVCRHNENYWLGGAYFGIGPGAASYVDGVRRTNHRSTTTYLNKVLRGDSAVAESETLGEKDKAHERLVFGLRRLAGIDIARFQAETGHDVDDLAGDHLRWLCDEGLLQRTVSHLRLTRKGLLVSDSIWPYLL